jgi:predicted aldo/keto reductase-like oxidoreductase
MEKDRSVSRRDFLKMGSAALAGAALTSPGGCAEPKSEGAKNRKIITRVLGRTGLELPVVSMGSSYAINLVRAALAEGIVYIHTSSGYSENRHERLLGQVFRDRPRDSFVVATSPDLPYRYDQGRGQSRGLGKQVDPGLIGASMTGSLQRLGLDHVDIYYLCSISDPEVVAHEPYLEALARLKENGQTRFLGLATHENEPAVIRAAAASGFWDVVLTAYNFRQSHRDQVLAAMRQAHAAGLGVVAMKTQAGVYWDRARNHKINMKAALKWALQEECVHTSIPAFSNFTELEEDLEVMGNLTLTAQEKNDLELGDKLGSAGLYCQQCGSCQDQCPAGMDIPTLMRSYMYAFAHGQPRKAKEALRDWSPQNVTCTDCRTCDVQCAQGFDVRARALELAPLLEVPEAFLG